MIENESFNARIRNALAPVVNMIELIGDCQSTTDENKRNDILTTIFEGKGHLQHSVEKLLQLGDKADTYSDNPVLYMSGYGDDSMETVVYSLRMPVRVTAYVYEDGNAMVEFSEKCGGGQRVVCQTTVVPDVEPPHRLCQLVADKNLDDNIAKTVAGWIAIYMRDGVFCTDSCKGTFVHQLDLRDVAYRLQDNLNDVYNRFRVEYK